ncbi:MAG: hypothetical protein AB7I19_05875 [Planctomycetota bacterium]
MNSPPNPRDELLAQLIAGDIDPNGPIAARAFAEDPSLRVEFEEFDALSEELADLGAIEQEILASVRSEPPQWQANDRHRRLALTELERSVAANRHSAWRRLAPWLATAAILAIGVIVGWPRDRPRTVDPNQYLGNEGETTIRAEGVGDPFDVLTWDHKPRFGERFLVTVYTADPARGGKRLASSAEIEETSRWSPRDDHEAGETPVEAWPDVVVVVVRLIRDANRTDTVGSAEIRRRP